MPGISDIKQRGLRHSLADQSQEVVSEYTQTHMPTHIQTHTHTHTHTKIYMRQTDKLTHTHTHAHTQAMIKTTENKKTDRSLTTIPPLHTLHYTTHTHTTPHHT